MAQLRTLDLTRTPLDEAPAVLAAACALQALTLLLRQPNRGDVDHLKALPQLQMASIFLERHTPASVDFLLDLQRYCDKAHITTCLDRDYQHWDVCDQTESEYNTVSGSESGDDLDESGEDSD